MKRILPILLTALLALGTVGVAHAEELPEGEDTEIVAGEEEEAEEAEGEGEEAEGEGEEAEGEGEEAEEAEPNEGDVIFGAKTVYGHAGDTVTVEFTIDGEYEAHGFNVWFNYDPDLLRVVPVSEDDTFEFGNILNTAQKNGNTVMLADVGGSIRLGIMCPMGSVKGSGTLFKVNFEIAEGVEEGDVLPIEILVKEFFNQPLGGENTELPYFAAGAKVVVGEDPNAQTPDDPADPGDPSDPTDPGDVPATGAISLVGLGVAAAVAGSGVVLFKKKED